MPPTSPGTASSRPTQGCSASPRSSHLCQTELALVVAEAVGHDPIKATGLILAHLGRICEQTRTDAAQVWRLRTNTRPADNPWEFVTRVADRRGESAADLYARERLDESELARSPLRDDGT